MRRQRGRKWRQALRPDKLLKKCAYFSEADFSADEQANTQSDSDVEDDTGIDRDRNEISEAGSSSRASFASSRSECESAAGSAFRPKPLTRGLSEIFGTQYTRTQDLRISVGTWNVAGKSPPLDLLLDEWLEVDNPADIYVIGFQEIVPLNAGNVLGTEDTGPSAKWEGVIRQTLDKVEDGDRKCYTTPHSPFNGMSDAGSEGADLDAQRPVMEDNTRFSFDELEYRSDRAFPSDETGPERTSCDSGKVNLKRVLSSTEQLGHAWSIARTESEPADWLEKLVPVAPMTTPSFQSITPDKLNAFERLLSSKKRPRRARMQYVRIASKQMVGIQVSLWVRRKLRRYVRSIRVSCVGIGLMGYLGNKGSVSVSLALHQTTFCFVCTHLSHGEKEGDELRRNAGVMEILKRTRFPSSKKSTKKLPKTIQEHDRVILLGDLNYRLNLSDREARALIETKKWNKLLENDQLRIELFPGKILEGWREGPIHFAPTYKYEMDSDQYTKATDKTRTPAWCDRILCFGDGLKLLSYKRVPSQLSDHRPVNAVFLAEVQVLSENKLIKALHVSKKVHIYPIPERSRHVELASRGR